MAIGTMRLRSRPLVLVFTVAAVVAGGAVGYFGAHSTQLGVAALAGLILMTVAAARPVRLAVVALLGTFVVQRLGTASFAPGGGGGISYSDALLALAAVASVPAVIAQREFRRLTTTLAASALYLASLLPSAIINHSQRTALEWLHRLFLVVGALFVGTWLVREKLAKPALRAFVCVAAVIALLALQDTLRHGLLPAAPLQMNKNFVGSQLAGAAVLLYVARSYIALPRRLWTAMLVIVLLGLLASQSRGAELGAASGLLLAFFAADRGPSRRGRVLGVLAVAVLGVFVYVSVHTQLTTKTAQDRRLDSIGQRYQVEDFTRELWRTSPIFGIGMKYFNTGLYGPLAQPANNAIDNELAESGLVGAAGFVIFQIGVLVIGLRRRRGNPLLLAGTALVACQLLHGQVDIYWMAGTVALPFLVLGMGLASPSSPRDHAPEERPAATGRHRAGDHRPTVARRQPATTV